MTNDINERIIKVAGYIKEIINFELNNNKLSYLLGGK